MKGEIRVMLAEDHAIVREGVKLLIDEQPDMTVVGEAASGDEAIELAQKLVPDIILMDVGLPGTNGILATRQIKRMFQGIKVVALTRHDEEGYLRQLIEAGASGFVLKQSPPAEMVKAVRAVAGGAQYLDPAIAEKVVKGFAGTSTKPPKGGTPASARDLEVIRLVALGNSNKEIAAHLNVSVKTVEAVKASAMQKLGLKDRVEVVRFALTQGWMKDS